MSLEIATEKEIEAWLENLVSIMGADPDDLFREPQIKMELARISGAAASVPGELPGLLSGVLGLVAASVSKVYKQEVSELAVAIRDYHDISSTLPQIAPLMEKYLHFRATPNGTMIVTAFRPVESRQLSTIDFHGFMAAVNARKSAELAYNPSQGAAIHVALFLGYALRTLELSGDEAAARTALRSACIRLGARCPQYQ